MAPALICQPISDSSRVDAEEMPAGFKGDEVPAPLIGRHFKAGASFGPNIGDFNGRLTLRLQLIGQQNEAGARLFTKSKQR